MLSTNEKLHKAKNQYFSFPFTLPNPHWSTVRNDFDYSALLFYDSWNNDVKNV